MNPTLGLPVLLALVWAPDGYVREAAANGIAVLPPLHHPPAFHRRHRGRSICQPTRLDGMADWGDRKGTDRLAAVASTTPPTHTRGGPMPYIEGFVAAVPNANRDVYIDHAKQAAAYFKNLGATRVTECWGDDVPRGEVTDFFRATQAKDDETVVFSWIEYPDKATRDAANEQMSADPEAMEMEMPFDGRRMFWGGFQPVLDE